MRKLLLVFTLVLLVTTLASAETFTQSQETSFVKSCTNSSGETCSATATCNLSIKYPRNNSFVLENVAMTNGNNGLFNYTLQDGNIAVLGNYNWDMFCCEITDCGEAHGTFLVTKTGVELSQDKAIIYLGMLGLLVLIFLSICVAVPLLPSGNNKDEDFFIGINNLKYLRPVLYAAAWGILLSIMFIASNISFLYLETELMGKMLFAIYSIMMWLTIPATFLWFLFILANIFRDKEMKEMIDRGVNIPSKMNNI